VAFSGGRDSSLVLALAVDVARSRGLEEPAAVTVRYPHLPETDERDWQERVVAHLGVRRWETVDLADENALTGPNAREVLGVAGPYFPYAAHTALPVARLAAGATVLTGEGGDLLLSPHRAWAAANLLDRRGRAEPAAWRAAAAGLSPGPVRASRAAAHAVALRPWLTGEGAALARRRAAADASSEPLSWPAATRHIAGLRALGRGLATLTAVYARAGAGVAHPLLDGGFVTALAGAYDRRGPLSRGRVVTDLAGHLLPPDVAFRQSKSDFTRALLSPDLRALVHAWDGVSGVDRALVRPDRLRAEWLRDRPSALSLQLLLEVVAAMRPSGVQP
jgi:asparagine synthase (glutamine-hydrolysing)